MKPSLRTQKPPFYQRHSSTLHYQTFPTPPPKSKGPPPSNTDHRIGTSSHSTSSHVRHGSTGSSHRKSPLPKRQLAILAVIALAEQTAFNSISPYLPDMATSFPEVKAGQVGLYVGLIASSFALAQFGTVFFWGWLSDQVGRKPVIMTGTLLTAACFVAFGFCQTLWQAVLVQILMGLVNGNQGVVSTCLGEITDRSNQSRAFTYLPVVYGIGGITGPIVGGLLVNANLTHPYLPPNLFSAVVLLVDLVLTALFLEESLEEAKELPPLGMRVHSLFAWLWQFTGFSRKPTYTRHEAANGQGRASLGDGAIEVTTDSDEETTVSENGSPKLSPQLMPENHEHLTKKEIFNRNTLLLLGTFLVFQLSNISYNSLYPIFGQAKPPTGRQLTPEEIGLSLAFAGAITIIFQVGIFNRIISKIGNKTTYRIGLGGFVLAFVLMPWVGYKTGPGFGNGRVALWIELGAVLIIKTVAAVGGLTSALLLITNSAPNHSVLGTLNGLAQTLSAAGRAVGPFISGSLFSLATRIEPKGEAMAFGIFGGISFIGFVLSFGITGDSLEAEGWDEESSPATDEGRDGDEESEDDGEHQPLVAGRHS
ncbi:MAG: hypothetical protein M1822_005372 [Bathelium mastoideum]|nr:MAG: hypothetical protein M1822_005372 [Bathelium mastoideum]